LPTVVRPHAFILEDTEKADAATATRAKLARMFAEVVGWQLDAATWRDPQDDLWKPNTTIKVHAPKALIYRESELLVRGVHLHADDSSGTARLDLVLPGVFSGAPPQELPWVE
jgi:prophage tail gpP-like protein